MKTVSVPALIASLSILLLPHAFGQGALTPPPGPPAPTMKSLDQVEARTPIDPTQAGFALPFTISQPGSYYFTANITAAGSTAGIIVASDDVTIDLNGFSLTGGGGGTARGIDVPAARKNLAIRNGTVRGWAGGGVRADLATDSVLEKLRASGNSGGIGGAALVVGNGSLIKDCVASNNPTTNGFKTFSGTTIIGCTASSNGSSGFFLGGTCTISDCTAFSNSLNGIKLFSSGVVSHCTAGTNSAVGISGGDGCLISDCVASFNLSHGIEAGIGASVTHCAVTNNTGEGISASVACTISECTVATNGGNGISTGDNNGIHHCIARSNGFCGFVTGIASTLTDSTVSNNQLQGISAATGCTIRNCTAVANKIAGVQGGAGCTVSASSSSQNQGYGFDLGAGSTITDSTAFGNLVYNVVNPNGSNTTTQAEGIRTGSDSTITRCTLSQNHGDGIFASAGSTIEACTVGANTTAGIYMSGGHNIVRGCTARGNGSNGIDARDTSGGCRILENTCASNGYGGIQVNGEQNRIESNSVNQNAQFGISAGGHNFLVRNTARGNPTNYLVAGPIARGSFLNFTAGGIITTSESWANFEY